MHFWYRDLQVSPVKEPRAAIFTLQVDNDQLKKGVTEAKKREEELKNELEEGRFTAGLVDL